MKRMGWVGLRTVVLLVLLIGCDASEQDFALPSSIQLGQSIEVLMPLLEQACHQIEELNYSGEMAAPFDRQTQINCSEMSLFGADRDVELMFNDGPLGHVWIHIDAEEVAELRVSLAEAFGPVIYETEIYTLFACGTVALRLDPPEVLVATPELIAELTGYPGTKQ